MNVTLIRIDAQDASGGAMPVFLSSHDIPEACHLGGNQWDPALAQLPDFALDFFGGAFSGQVSAPRTSFAVATSGLAAFAATPSTRARFADARVRIWHGDITSAATVDLGPLTLRFDGRIANEPTIDDATRTATFEAAVQDSWADKPLLALFAGTGAIEGPADLTGQVKPLVLGNARFCGATLIDRVDNVWMVSNGPMQSVNEVYDRIASLGPSAGNFADLASLKAASIPNGSWGTCLALGLVRFGAPPDGRVSFDVSGSNSGTGGYVRLPGAIIRRIADLAGGTVNAASLTGLDSARPYNLALQLRDQATAREAIGQIADSVGAVAGVSLRGELFAQALSIGTPSDTLAPDDTSALRVAPVEELAKAAPNWRLATEAELTFEVHSVDEAAFEYRWQGEYSASRVYRIDDVVTGPDGAAWVYISATPAAGQALPLFPTASNAFWQVFQRPGSAAVAPANANRVPFSEFENQSAWYVSAASGVTDGALSFPTIGGLPTLTYTATAGASGNFGSFKSARFRVQGGERLSCQARMSTNIRSEGRVTIRYFDASGAAIVAQPEVMPFAGIGTPEQYLFEGFTTAPANAVAGELEIFVPATAAGALSASISQPMVTSSAPGQTIHPRFSRGPNASDGADPNNLITIDGAGNISGIGTANINVDNRAAILTGTIAARPASGTFIGQGYAATDTGEISQWDGFNWIPKADITATVSGVGEIVLAYNSTGQLQTALPVLETYSLIARGIGAYTSGVSWSVTVLTGSFAGAAPSISGSGSGQLSINSDMTSPEALLRLTPSLGGQSFPPFAVKIVKSVAVALSNPSVTDTLVGPSTSSFTTVGEVTITLGASTTAVNLNAAALALRTANTNLPLGESVVEMKWTRETTFGGGVFVDVGAVATSSPNPGVVADGEGFRSRQVGSITCNRSATGLAAGSQQRFRLVGRISAGNVRTTNATGTVSVTP